MTWAAWWEAERASPEGSGANNFRALPRWAFSLPGERLRGVWDPRIESGVSPALLHLTVRNSPARTPLVTEPSLSHLQPHTQLPPTCPLTNLLQYMLIIHHLLFFIFLLFRATPAVYGGSQARGPTRATAASLRHSNAGSELHLRPTPQLAATLDP